MLVILVFWDYLLFCGYSDQVLDLWLQSLSFFWSGCSCHHGWGLQCWVLGSGSSKECHLFGISIMLQSKLALPYLQVCLWIYSFWLFSWNSFQLESDDWCIIFYCRSEHTSFQGGRHNKASTHWWICLWVHYLICHPAGMPMIMCFVCISQ